MSIECGVSNLDQWAELTARRLELNLSEPFTLTPLSGDAGFRKYYRIEGKPSVLAVNAPPESEDSRAFVAIAKALRERGVHTPKIYACDFDLGFLLIEDLGDDLFLSHLDEASVDGRYGEALHALLRIQQCAHDYSLFPSYDRKALHSEMALFHQWFVPKLLGYSLNQSDNELIERFYQRVLASALEQPQVLVHRDYHSRNIMLCADGSPGIIDFQDAVIGPFTYDLVSLLRDCYIRWQPERVSRWVIAYANMAVDVGIIPPLSETQLMKWFDLMGLQRHIKVLGIFARLSLRDGKHTYLNDLPLVTQYVRDTLANYDDTDEPIAEFHHWFDKKLSPLIAQQAWMK